MPVLPCRRSYTLLLGVVMMGLLLAPAGSLRADPENDLIIQAALEGGTLIKGQKILEDALTGRTAPDDAEANRRRYALGIVQFLRAGEKLGQSWRHFGLGANRLTASLPFLRLPVGSTNPADAAPISYEDFRTVFITFLADVQSAEATLASLPDDPGEVPMRPGLVRFDYAGDGKPTDTEAVWVTYQRLNHGAQFTEKDANEFLIKFDAGDVPWFRGYCHILSALAETVLAYDETRLFDRTAHLFFARPKTPFPFLSAGSGGHPMGMDTGAISDLIAFIHLLRFPVRERIRLASALDHLTRVPALSRESWRRIQAETDDDHEWIPNPRQTGVLPGVRVTQIQIDAWLKTLDEVDAILAGRKLLPFWRTGTGPRQGVNLHRVFTEATDFDLILWGQGTAATPYLEEGTLTDAKLWREIGSAFGGNALGFALYFN